MNWTEKHNEFCLENSIPPAARLLWQWLMMEGNNQEIEPDLSEFNTWVQKHRGKGYCHAYLKKMLDILVENRVVNIVKKFSWKIFRLLVRPLEWLNPPKRKNLQNPNPSYETPTPNPSKAVEDDIQQQLILDNQELLSQEEIYYTTDEIEVLNRPKFEIKAALLLFKLRGGKEKILNPEGWIRSCLRRRCWEEPTNYAAIVQHFSGAVMELEDYFSDRLTPSA